MTPTELAAIKARDAANSTVALDTFAGMEVAAHACLDRRALLAHIAELEAAARKVTCARCSNTGRTVKATGNNMREELPPRFVEAMCPDCADLRALMGEQT